MFFIHLQLAKKLAFGNDKIFHKKIIYAKDMTNNYYLITSSFMFILINSLFLDALLKFII